VNGQDVFGVSRNHAEFWHLILANSPEKDPENFWLGRPHRDESSCYRGDVGIDAPWWLVGLKK
jgi:hypothetical protein